jgi:hypothetical protein
MNGFESMLLLARGGEAIFVLLVVGALAFALGMRLLAGTLDHDRIRQYIQSRGGRVQSIHWSPFGRGWFGDKHNRIYDVAYDDAGGQPHVATCKTSFWSGVYWTEDQVIASAPFAKSNSGEARFIDDPVQLAQENQRLKRELKQRG